MAELAKAVKSDQRNINELLENKATLLKQLAQAQDDIDTLSAKIAFGSVSPSPDSAVQEKQEAQHQARVKQLKEMIMAANQKKNELEAENKELKRRLEVERQQANQREGTVSTSPQRPASRYGVADNSASEDES